MPPTEAALIPPTAAIQPGVAEAWSDPIAVPDFTPQRDWRRLLGLARYAVPAVVVAVMAVVLLPHQRPAGPTPAPPTAVVMPRWVPDHTRDDAYLKALTDGGYEVGGINSPLADAPDRQKSLEVAYWSCTYLSQGHSMSALVKHWDEAPYDTRRHSPQENHDEDVQWMNIVVAQLCPQFDVNTA